MTQEDKKQLLMKDLCARLPFNVKCYDFWYNDEGDKIDTILTLDCIYPSIMKYKYKETDAKHNIERIKPYLRSMSSMTEEEKEKLRQEYLKDEKLYAECITMAEHNDNSMHGKVIPHFAADWCNEHHFDYRGLIPKGLAIDVTEGMYDSKN